MEITAALVKKLRDVTGAGMMECKAALQETGGDADQAVDLLRKRGQAKAAKRGERAASEGVIGHYVHFNGKVGSLVEVDCETDFVAKNEDFIEFARDIAVHVASAAPRYVSEEDVPDDERERERAIFEAQADESKPPEVRQKIAEGRLRKWLEEVVLLNQAHVNADKHEGRTIEQLRADLSARVGENVVIRRFARYAVGE
jgi:elongation factor Ts